LLFLGSYDVENHVLGSTGYSLAWLESILLSNISPGVWCPGTRSSTPWASISSINRRNRCRPPTTEEIVIHRRKGCNRNCSEKPGCISHVYSPHPLPPSLRVTRWSADLPVDVFAYFLHRLRCVLFWPRVIKQAMHYGSEGDETNECQRNNILHRAILLYMGQVGGLGGAR